MPVATLSPSRSFAVRLSDVIKISAVQEGQRAGSSNFLPSLSTRPPTKQAATMATITFKCEEKDDKLEVVVLSCKGLPDLDGAFNLTDAYVVVKIGAGKDKPQKTKPVEGSLNPKFDPETSTFLFDVRS